MTAITGGVTTPTPAGINSIASPTSTTGETSTTDGTTVRKFLPEVQALRALAVLLVVLYHLRPDLVPGGFVGVDVFFVISGYLITGHMIREVRDTGRLRLAHFWGNRARRILPAGLLVILLVVLTSTFTAPVSEWRGFGRQALGSVFYAQNWLLAADSVNYSASDNAATPFQHFWSLAVEEQFYLLWPFVVILAGWIATRIRNPRRTSDDAGRSLSVTLLTIFGVLVTISFVWSALEVARHDSAAYFVTNARLWELGVGGVLAVVIRYTERRRLLRSVLALAGLATIGVVAFTYNGNTPFPGVGALPPVLGSAAIIAAGQTSGLGSVLTWIVNRGAVQWLGNISYSLYLWHFPIAVDFTMITKRQPTILETLGLLVMMIAGAAISYYLLEQPVRKSTWARRSDRRALIAAGLAMILVGLSTTTLWIRSSHAAQHWDHAAQQARQHGTTTQGFGAASARNGSYAAFLGSDKVITPDPITAKTKDQFLEAVSGHCGPKPTVRETRWCEFGNPDSSTVIAVVGDSHARMYTPPILQAARHNGWRVVTFIHTSCPYSDTPRIFPGAADCITANRETERRLIKLHPAVVVTAFYAGSRFVDDGRKWHGAAGLASAWSRLTASGTRVLVIKDAPQPRTDVVDCVAQHYTRPSACKSKRSNALRGHALVDAAAKGVKGVTVLDLTKDFCTKKACPAVIGDVLVYIDGNHIGETYSTTLTPDIEPALLTLVQPTR